MVRARDLGIPFGGTPGPVNAITDVAGVTVGHTTLVEGEGPLKIGQGPVRTGVTVILPHGPRYNPVFAGWHTLNGNGEVTGLAWLRDSGLLSSPIALTNTHSTGTVRDALVQWIAEKGYHAEGEGPQILTLPVLGETFDGYLNDIMGFHVRRKHVFQALDQAAGGPVAEGSVGAGTGNMCYDFKGGIGTASRRVETGGREYCLGVLVQTNFGDREDLLIHGVEVGKAIPDRMPELSGVSSGGGSIMVVIATDAPLLPHQLDRLSRHVTLGLGKLGAVGENRSGDVFLAFSTANPEAGKEEGLARIEMLPNPEITPLFRATVQATEEAILNSLVAAETMTGINNNTVYALPHDRLRETLGERRPALQ